MRRLARFRLVAAALAVVALSSSFFAAPAGATEIVPAPPGWDIGSGGSGGGGGPGITQSCTWAGMRGYVSGRLMFENWPGCRTFTHGGRTYNWTIHEYRHYCTHTFEVWRFYGTRANPTQVRTVNRTNIDPCRTTVSPIVNDAHPEDSSNSPYMGITTSTPYRYGTAFSDLVGVQASMSVIGTHDVGREFVFAANWPFRRNGWCNTLMSRDPNPPAGEQYGDMTNIWRWVSAHLGTWWADVVMDRTGGDYAAPVFGNNNVDCSSGPVDFAVPSSGGPAVSEPDYQKISGFCAIPVWREHARTRNPVTGAEFFAAIRPNAVSWAGTPEVYSHYYGANSTSVARTTSNLAVIQKMRESVMAEVANRPWAATTPGLYAEDQTRPPWATADNPDLGAAAFAAAVFSHCSFSSSNIYDEGSRGVDSSRPTMPGDAVRLYVEVPEAGQVGGEHRPAEIRTRLATTPDGRRVRCGDMPSGWCDVTPNGPKLDSVDLDLSTAHPFLTAPAGADYKVMQPLRPDPVTGTADSTTTRLRLAFFKATTEGSPYRLSLGPNAHAVISGFEGSDRYVTVCAPFGGACETTSTQARVPVTRRVPIEVVYVRSLDTLEVVPPEFPVVGATATPIEGRGN